MSDSDNKSDPPVCPFHGEECLRKEQIVSIEAEVAALRNRVERVDARGSRQLAQISDQITGAERARAENLKEVIDGIRRLNQWAPSVDRHLEGMATRSGELSQKVEDLGDEVRELQGIVTNGNGRTEK